MQLTPEELVSEFHDAVMELYFARKRIAALEAENADLKALLSAAGSAGSSGPAGPAGSTGPGGSAVPAGPRVGHQPTTPPEAGRL
ncbi:hypothetical protein [Streptomyces sp. NBC_00038]|uniref:hypothetical protein n=1 Tax=Streptomyces sp. NBC_00038 TaxID=2903615 RepID=UPI0022568E0B|nr:hypothetical protein [Streptomyces sp. NBC_00038]MCX5558938.1 hypothetical protein [Streptomyces sp. NBC_00038]